MISTNQKRILITGASSGIGYATAEQLTSKGHLVTITARNEEKALITKNALAKKGLLVDYFIVDLSIWSSIQAVTEKIKESKTLVLLEFFLLLF
uniref:SDR family NAD(P)-dependent oxidoreductase n=1 Tax=Heterorhabditis bacteriophora TaxID=37862 RepID=A0A1I7WR47_HETBA